MSAEKSIVAEVERELLENLAESAKRSMLAGFLFGLLCVLILRNALNPGFLGGWLAAFAALNATRAVIASRFRRTTPAARDFTAWRRRAIAGHACGGLMWGVLVAAGAIHAPALERQAVIFIFAVLTTLQAASRANYPAAVHAYLACALVPVAWAIATIREERAALLALFFAVFAFAVTRVGRHSHRVMSEGIAQRLENARLLADLTARTNALDQANRGKARFLAAASHDLRQPMQALVLLVESLQARTHDPETRQLVVSMRNSVDTMASLLNAILDLSKFEAGTVRPQRSHFAIGPMLQSLAETHAPAAAGKGLRLRVRPCPHVVDSDPVLLFRVLSNLVSNAIRYTDHGGILIGCRRRADGLHVEVWDTGAGIPEDQREKIFRDFYQIGNPERDREQGLGLGLAIVSRTAELLGHEVRVRSRAGRGSVFSLQVQHGDPALVRAPSPQAGAPAQLEGCRILVIDDDPDVRAALVRLLRGWGCRVHAAGSGREARAQVEQLGDGPDIVLSDYRLPGGETGLEVIQAMARDPPYPAGVLMSGDIVPEVLSRVEQSGYTLLHKPLRPARLRALLGSFWRARAGAPEPADGEPQHNA
jgi:signal transduction histidine kinase